MKRLLKLLFGYRPRFCRSCQDETLHYDSFLQGWTCDKCGHNELSEELSHSRKLQFPVTGKEVAALLSHIHHHDDDNGAIIYYHQDLAEVLEAIGLTQPKIRELLFPIHNHYPYDSLDVVYYETDLLPVLEKAGLPAPEWGRSISVKNWLKERTVYGL